MKYSQKVFQITDLIRKIGKYKHQFETFADFQQLNNSHNLQHLIFHIFYYTFNSSVVIYNPNIEERLVIKIDKTIPKHIFLTFQIFQKYKRKECIYMDILSLYPKLKLPFKLQQQISNHILKDNMLLQFFKSGK